MNEEHEFLEAIAAAPEDDAPRLILADWLEERGELDRAAFIRHQCTAAAARASGDDETSWEHEARAWQLRRRHGRLWAGAWADWAHSGEFHRGFVSAVFLNRQKKHREELPTGEAATIESLRLTSQWMHREIIDDFRQIAWHPGQIRSLDLTGLWNRHGWADAFLKFPAFSRLNSLHLNGREFQLGDTLQLVQNHPHLSSLKSLRIEDAIQHEPGAFLGSRLLAREFPQLRELSLGSDLWESWLPPAALLVRSESPPPLMEQLTALDIRGFATILPQFLEPGWAPELVRLRASADASIRGAPTSLDHLKNLARVDIRLAPGASTRDQVASTIAGLIRRLETLPALERLILSGPLDARALETLARASFPRLKSLHLLETSIASLGPLRHAAWIPGLRELRAEGMSIDVADRASRDLFDSPALSGLGALHLRGLSLKGAEAESLVRSAALRNLQVLCLQKAGLTASATRRLADPGAFPKLALLDLSENIVPRQVKVSLRKRHAAALNLRPTGPEEWWARAPFDVEARGERSWNRGHAHPEA